MISISSFAAALLSTALLGELGAEGGVHAKEAKTRAAQDVFFIDSSLELDARLLSWRVLTGVGREGRGQRDLVLTLLLDNGSRELRLHNLNKRGVERDPRVRVSIKEDITAWSVANVRPEAGLELLLITDSGVWSYSVTHSGYRGNVQALVKAPMLFDIPSPDAFPYWAYRLPSSRGAGLDPILLPQAEGLVLWSAQTDDAGDSFYTQQHVVGADSEDPYLDYVESYDAIRRYRNASDRNGPFMGDGDDGGDMLASAQGFDAPAVVDVDGDGRRDVLALGEDGLRVYLSAGRVPTRTEPMPKYMDPGDGRRRLMLSDVDSDGDIDFLVILQGDLKSLGKAPAKILVLINDGHRLLPDKPTQVLKLDGTELRVQVTDVNGDGRGDLVVRKFELPGVTDAITGLKFEFTHLVFFGEGRAFARKPAVKHVETYDERNVQDAVGNYELRADCSGDGVADLAAVDLEGRITLRRIKFRDGGLFRSDSWSLDPAPWKSFDTPGELTSLRVQDLNGDGLGDLISGSERRLTIQVTQRRGSR